MKKQLKRFISSIIILCLCVFFLTGCQKQPNNSEKSHIVYIEVTPDSILYDGSINHYDFDFDKNSVIDYRLIVTGGTSGSYFCKVGWNACELDTYNEDSVAVDNSDTPDNPLNFPLKDPLALNQDDVIDSSLSWGHDAVNNPYADFGIFLVYYKPGIYCSPEVFSGSWKNATDKYLALKLKFGGATHYGWIRLSTGTDARSMIVKDYAYNSIQNERILAGQTK